MLYALALIAGYFGLLMVLSIVARPYRTKLAALANELVADYPDDELIRDLCGVYLATAYAWRAAPIRFLVFMIALLRPAYEIDKIYNDCEREHPASFRDERLSTVLEYYYASIASVNPIFGTLMYFARGLFRIKMRMHYRDRRACSLAELASVRA